MIESETVALVAVDDLVVEVSILPSGGTSEEEVSFHGHSLQEMAASMNTAISAVANSIRESVDAAKPNKISIEFGCELAIESGQLTAVLVKGSGKANFKILMEWDRPGRDQD